MKTKSTLLLAATICIAFAAKAQNVVQGGNSIAATMKIGDLTTGYDLQFLTNSSAKMVIKSGGNIGIGTTLPSYLLDVSGGDINVSGANGYRLGGYMMLSNNNIFTDVFLGFYAGYNSTSAGYYNSFIGYAAGYENTSGGYNTATGGDALFYNTTGNYNTANGALALEDNTTGGYNTAVGGNTLLYNTTGSNNLANGAFALEDNSTGGYNTATGAYALSANNGSYNTANGYEALLSNTTGSYNVAIGSLALYANTSNTSYNTAIGYKALYSNKSGTGNVATGYEAGASVTTGNNNTANGDQALTTDTSGYSNVAMGSGALLLANGNCNTATGALAENGLYASQNNGSENTSDGYSALYGNTTGVGNTAIGASALFCWAAGNNNTALGYASGGCNNDTLNNVTAIGYQSFPTASNEIVLGNTAITEIGAYVSGITNLSDARFKKNIQENVHGLDFIMKLKPVTYNLDVTKLNSFLGVDNNQADKGLTDKQKATIATINDKSIKAKEAIVTSGFIAQDVEKAAKDVNYNFDGVKVPVSDKDHYGLVYDEFVVPLVKGMQEQQAEIDSLKKMIGVLVANHTNTATPQTSGTTTKTLGSDSLANVDVTLADQNVVVLNQNVPNPFSEQTVISYNIPQGSGPAQILFYGSNGQLIKAVNVNANGPGQITVYASDLSNGIYSYSLVIDGKTFATKRMMKGN